MECANGEFGAPWDGCIAKGSVRVRCPERRLPCNEPALNGDSFSCYMDCTNREGVKECLVDGKFFATLDQYCTKLTDSLYPLKHVFDLSNFDDFI